MRSLTKNDRTPRLGVPAMLTVTPFYAALVAMVFVALSVRVIRYRRQNAISLGDQGDQGLLKRMRAQANCAEYAPIAVLLLLLCELQNVPNFALHVLGITLVMGRALHGYGFSARPPIMALRVGGMMLTLGMICAAIVALLAATLI